MPRVLSIQSHVVHGHVGNKSATFPLQLLGFNVDPLNTVQFSNHTGYPSFTGERIDGDKLLALVAGLEQNGILPLYSHLLTGYLGRESILRGVIQVAAKLKSCLRPIVFLMDPVLGDNNSLYVPPELVPIYRDELCRLADIITPNAFEAELLAADSDTEQRPLKTLSDVVDTLARLHRLGPPCVVITSVDLDPASARLSLFASHAPSRSMFKIDFPRLNGSFTGTGDLFAAVLIARVSSASLAGISGGIDPSAFKSACEFAVATMHHVLTETIETNNLHSNSSTDVKSVSSPADTKYRELSLVESKHWIESPTLQFFATDFSL
ncbi:hypothetical protein HK100_003634 [Physocladia obscura]|uniref:pyridoxal kinase n=1 Tax=Physocladia obscura TaxID=109957 RepID=A0AAD5XJ99_9FUNG|nr:hypothetical protein HK100_003634 [Physocladia obscura]